MSGRTCCPVCGVEVLAIRKVGDVVTYSPCRDTTSYAEFGRALVGP